MRLTDSFPPKNQRLLQVFRQANFEKDKESSDHIVVLERSNAEDISKAKATSPVSVHTHPAQITYLHAKMKIYPNLQITIKKE